MRYDDKTEDAVLRLSPRERSMLISAGLDDAYADVMPVAKYVSLDGATVIWLSAIDAAQAPRMGGLPRYVGLTVGPEGVELGAIDFEKHLHGIGWTIRRDDSWTHPGQGFGVRRLRELATGNADDLVASKASTLIAWHRALTALDQKAYPEIDARRFDDPANPVVRVLEAPDGTKVELTGRRLHAAGSAWHGWLTLPGEVRRFGEVPFEALFEAGWSAPESALAIKA